MGDQSLTTTNGEDHAGYEHDVHGGDARSVIETAQLAAKAEAVDPAAGDLLSVQLPAGGLHKVVDLERFLDTPRRTKGTYRLQTVADLLSFASSQGDEAPTTVWVDAEAKTVTAVFNDATPLEPEWRDHRAVLELQHTPEWEHWAKLDGQYVGQTEFAEHIEDGIDELVKPDAATMLELAQSFHASTDARFARSERLDSGEVKFNYTEDTTATAGKGGDIEVPQFLELRISPFVGEDPYKVVARFRYRLRNGQLSLSYRLERPERVIRDSLEHVQARITEQHPRTYLGTAAPAA